LGYYALCGFGQIKRHRRLDKSCHIVDVVSTFISFDEVFAVNLWIKDLAGSKKETNQKITIITKITNKTEIRLKRGRKVRTKTVAIIGLNHFPSIMNWQV